MHCVLDGRRGDGVVGGWTIRYDLFMSYFVDEWTQIYELLMLVEWKFEEEFVHF